MNNENGKYLTIAQDGQDELVIKKSRFICHLKRVVSADEAINFITNIKKEHYKATHNCSAYIINDFAKGQLVEKSSDDGEPSGTAGIPMLEVLRNKKLNNVCAVVTRYFGGIKLGAGGLIRAYAGSVSQTLEQVKIVQKIEQREVSVTIDYEQNDRVRYFFKKNPQFALESTDFAQQVILTVLVDDEQVATFKDLITNLLSGKVKFKLGKTQYREILV